ncbi:MAG: cobalamin biosynthesis protein, partial [Hungatella sp.]
MIRGHIAAMIVGFLLDLCFGDPHWLPHPVRAMGWLIMHVEKGLRLLCPKEARWERIAGLFLVLMVLGVTGGTAYGCLWLAGGL